MIPEIFDGQYAEKISPDIKRGEDINIKRFYNDKLGIYIDKKHDNIRVYCKVLAHGIPDRLNGYYTKYSNRTDPFYVTCYAKYTNDFFANFKQDVENNFCELGFRLVYTEEKDNVIFRNIEKLDFAHTDPGIHLTSKDFDDTINLIKDHEHLEFKAGKINDITTFCREILKSDLKDITIAIFTGDKLTNEGHINVFLDKNPIPFAFTDNTKKILNDRSKKLDKDRKEKTKRQVKEQAKNDIKSGLSTAIQGLTSINQCVDNMQKAECSESEIKDIEKDPDIKQLLDKFMSKLESITEQKTERFDTLMVGAGLLTALIVGVAIGMYAQANYLPNNFMKNSPIDQGVTPTAIIPNQTAPSTPVIIANNTSIPTPTVTLATPVENITRNKTLPNNTNNTASPTTIGTNQS